MDEVGERTVLRAIADWWDAVELWLTQLAFPLQVLMAAVVLLPLCWWAAAVADRVLDAAVDVVTARLGARRARYAPSAPRSETRS